MALAPEADKELKTLAQSIADEVGGFISHGPIKLSKDIERKVTKDYGGDFSQLKDTVRTTIIPRNEAGVAKVLEKLRPMAIRPPKVIKAESHPLGYSGINVNVKLKNGLTGEIQINTPAAVYGKETEKKAREALGDELYERIKKTSGLEPGLGHKLYERWRILQDKESPNAKAIETSSKEYYSMLNSLSY